MSALEASEQVLYRASVFQWLSPEGATRLSTQVGATLSLLNQAIAAIQLDPEIPDLDSLVIKVGHALCEVANELDTAAVGKTGRGATFLVPTTVNTDEVQEAVDQLLRVMREQLARLERS